MKTKATSGIKIEPHKNFKKAIVGVDKRGRYVYGYEMLVEVCEDLYKFNREDALDWVDYNIVNLAVNGFKIKY